MLYKKYITPASSLFIIILLVVGLSVMRIAGALGPSSLRWLMPLGFCVMAVLPWILLTREGRRQIGLQKPGYSPSWLLAIIAGISAALFCFALGYLLFGITVDNWFVNIGNSYKAMMDTSAMSFWVLSLIFTIPAILFSPIGEEIFYRGQLQKTLEQKFTIRTSTVIECTLFALVHQVHHGIIKTTSGLTYLPVSGAIWFVLMFLVAWMFALLRSKSGSIFVAIIAHVVFNITMNTTIFLFLW
ncbi:MAG: hypothetical protein B0W54_22480 [Cellvibrio sp. 79]|nr:MAG: hypothetical protein B0W54_22480 [Cellvibrio sp. 79]